MKTFLYSVAEDIYQKLQASGEDLTQTAVIFPNKRAGLFFNEYIARIAGGKPIWSPDYMTISDLFSSLSPRKKGDNILLVCELYQAYLQVSQSKESLDQFYGWGEIILSDFDDVDKNMVNASALFHNIDDLKDIEETISYLSEEQQETIRRFFNQFKAESETTIKQHFRSFWNMLPELYQRFNERLKTEGIAYEGALYREAVQNLNTETLPYKHYAFVGFNVLNKVEQTLLKEIKAAGKAWFYWDYDTYYLNDLNQEAGWFISQDLKEFGNELPEELFNNMEKPQDITYISAPTNNAQARFLPQWLSKNLTEVERDTAVVLCDESLLQPVLHSIPDNVREINVTMGFPLTNTPIYSLLTALLALQDEGYDAGEDRYRYDAVANVLKHPYLQMLTTAAEPLLGELTQKNRFLPLRSELGRDELLEQIFCRPSASTLDRINYLTNIVKRVAATFQRDVKDNRMEEQLYRESLFNAYTTLERFHKLTEDNILQITSPKTLTRLLIRVLTGISIPFHGEPARGLQVMGVLETRNLDFKHLIMLSVNEGNLPKGINENSLIPYNLRTAYGLTTIRHQVSVYAYYFYRLLQRTEKATLIYSEGTNGGISKGEMSRFMLQYQLESRKKIQEMALSPAINPTGNVEITVDKTPEMLEQLAQEHNDERHYLSPTALNCYLTCPLKFYFTYIGKMREEEDVSSVVDPRYFGNIFHRAAELLYTPALNRTVTRGMLEDVEKTKIYETYVNQSFNENFFQLKQGESAAYNGEQLIKRDLLLQYIRQLIACDKQQAPFTIVGLEENVSYSMAIETPQNETYHIAIGGKIDRRDRMTIDGKERTRIVDYKTGGSPQTIRDMQQLFTPSSHRPDKIFQTFVYAFLASKKLNVNPLTPALFFVHKSFQKDYRPELQMNKETILLNKDDVDDFESGLRQLLEAIFDLEQPFSQTEDTTACSYCTFKNLCRR